MSTMMKVAREAKVAVSTVSLTLNHRDRVKPETRERVEQAMQRLGYRLPDRNKVTRQNSSAMRIAFIYALDPSNRMEDSAMTTYCREIVSGMQDYMAGTASFLSIFRGAVHVDKDVMVNEQINANEFDGVILFGASANNGYMDRLQQSGLPMVVINRLPEHGHFSCVTLDYYGGAQQAIRHLHSLGHQRIAAVVSNDSGKWLDREICEGTKDALKQCGIEPAIDMGKLHLHSPESFSDFCKQVRDQKVTAVFTGDYFAVRCVNTLSELGVRVPEDVSVIGFDDRGIATENGLSLTTIGYDKRRMGRMSIRMLERLSRSDGKLKWLSGAVATYLVDGQTTAVRNEGR